MIWILDKVVWYMQILALTFTIAVNTDAATCSPIWKNAKIINKYTQDKLMANASDTNSAKEGTVVKLSCVDNTKQVNGSDISRCLSNGTWDNKPKCVPGVRSIPTKPVPWILIGSCAGGGVIVIIVITIITVVCVRKRKQRAKKRTESAAQRDSSVPFEDFRNSDLSNNYINSRQLDDTYHQTHDSKIKNGNFNERHDQLESRYASAGSVNIYRTSDGISMIGSSVSVLGTSNIPIFKVWTCKRTRRKFIKADSLAVLARKAAAIYAYYNPIRFTLEEDGTEIDNDETLLTCSGNTLMVLAGNEQWTDAHGNSNVQLQKYTFDVCSHDRLVRKLILAEGLKDLIHQAPAYFGYTVKVICLESDGTYIDDDDSLITMSSQLLMALSKEHRWTDRMNDVPAFQNKNADLEYKINDSFSLKVWSEDERRKKIVKADNCIDFHIKAAKALGLEMPIKIRVKDSETIVSTDTVLQENKTKVFIAVPVGSYASPKYSDSSVYTSPGNYYQGRFNNPDHNTYDVVIPNAHKTEMGLKGDMVKQNDTPPYARVVHNHYPTKRPEASQNNESYAIADFRQSENRINHPDIVKSSQVSSLLPSRYNPSQNVEKPSEIPYLERQINRKDPVKVENFAQSTLESRNTEQKMVPKTNLPDDQSVLPYSDLSPSNQFDFRKKDIKRNSRPVDDDTSLPYSSLEPSHRKTSNQINNFEIMRQEGKRKTKVHEDSIDHDWTTEHKPSSLYRQHSFIVTGGAKQSRNSDVLF